MIVAAGQLARLAAFRRTGLPGAACLGLAALLTLGGCGNGAPGDPAADGARSQAQAPADSAPPVVAMAAAVEPAPRPDGPLPAGAGCITAECHATYETARYIHGAVSAGDCGMCHEPDRGDHTYPLKREGNETCTFCHTITGHRVHQHAAMEAGCIACHRPHVSDAKYLLTAPTVRDVCLQCHLSDDRPFLHGPYAAGECSACHEPHESNFQHLLRGGEGPAHCYMCHAETEAAFADAHYVHEPAADNCTICHDPHASAHEYALRDSIEGTCYSCHEDLERLVAAATAPHAAVFTADRCANCHDSHVADRPGLLREREDVLCLQCHDREVPAADGQMIPSMESILGQRAFLHGPVRAGECSPCHNVHGADHSRLLREDFTADFYAPFDLGHYALCFTCHVSELVLAERTTTLTGFRDGDVNLHYVHVNRARKGRTCRTCHEIHGSNLPRHLATSVPFEESGWAMPIQFQQTETGGSCSPGCHEPQTYSRAAKLDPSPVAPGGAP